MKSNSKSTAKSNTKKKKGGSAFWKWVKRIVIGLFVAQLVYIVVLKWVYPPVTLTQLGSLFGG